MPHPHLTVAVVCVKDNEILMVNEVDNGIKCWNQPAGHVEAGESLTNAAIREALEETGYQVELESVQGIYQGIHESSKTHYIRVCFRATAGQQISKNLDSDIIEAKWLPVNALLAGKYPLRSNLTFQTLEDSVSAPIYPLELIHNLDTGVHT